MTNNAETEFLRTLIPSLPTEFTQRLRSLCSSNPANESFFENFVRLLSGADCTSDASNTLREEWAPKQLNTRKALSELMKPYQQVSTLNGGVKRPHDDASSEGSKRPRLSPTDGGTQASDIPQFTLHAVSTTSPVRKKVDITIRKSTIAFINPTSGNVEATVPLSCFRRAFLLPTRGKTKGHWTVVLLSTDSTGKPAAKGSSNDSSPQIIFGLDATTAAPLTTTSYNEKSLEGEKEVHAKGSASLPAIRSLLANLPSHIIRYEPTTDIFKSTVNQFGSAGKSASNSPGIEAYRAAKPGTLWFMKEGILWGESKPCEFWAFEDLLSAAEGVRLSPGSGRVFSVTLARKEKREADDDDDGMHGDSAEEDVGVETELGMIDSRERDAVFDWVRKYQNMFGRKPGEAPSPEKGSSAPKHKAPQQGGPATIRSLALNSESEDEDFVGSDSDDENSDAESDSGDDDEDGEGDEDEAEGSDAEGEEDNEADDDAEDDLDPARHPLMRPGAVPKMSKAAMDMAVGMVEDDLMGVPSDEGDGEEVDELDD